MLLFFCYIQRERERRCRSLSLQRCSIWCHSGVCFKYCKSDMQYCYKFATLKLNTYYTLAKHFVSSVGIQTCKFIMCSLRIPIQESPPTSECVCCLKVTFTIYDAITKTDQPYVETRTSGSPKGKRAMQSVGTMGIRDRLISRWSQNPLMLRAKCK